MDKEVEAEQHVNGVVVDVQTIKYEDIYLRCYESVARLREGLKAYFPFYNEQRPHQSLGYHTPAEVYRQGRAA